MTREEESYILDSIESIRKKTDEDNIMLKQLIEYVNTLTMNASEENIHDFGRNVLANLISNKVNNFKI